MITDVKSFRTLNTAASTSDVEVVRRFFDERGAGWACVMAGISPVPGLPPVAGEELDGLAGLPPVAGRSLAGAMLGFGFELALGFNDIMASQLRRIAARGIRGKGGN